MVKKALVETKLEDVRSLVEVLDKSDLKPELVAWYYYDDLDDWRLVLAGVNVDNYLSGKEAIAYKKIAEIIRDNDLSKIELADIKFVRRDNPLIKALGFLVRTTDDEFSCTGFSATTFNGVFIKEVILLRSAMVAPAKKTHKR